MPIPAANILLFADTGKKIDEIFQISVNSGPASTFV